MYRALVGLGILCGFIIASIYSVTKPIITRNKEILLTQAIQAVLPAANKFNTFVLNNNGSFEPRDKNLIGNKFLHVGYNSEQQIIGFAIEAKGLGYQDTIHVLYGYSHQQHIISGYEILQSRETPGLGTRISTEQTFKQQFSKLDVSLDPSGIRLDRPFDYKRPANRRQFQQQVLYLDTISGATVSSRALIKIISNSAARWIPKIEARKQDFFEVGRDSRE